MSVLHSALADWGGGGSCHTVFVSGGGGERWQLFTLQGQTLRRAATSPVSQRADRPPPTDFFFFVLSFPRPAADARRQADYGNLRTISGSARRAINRGAVFTAAVTAARPTGGEGDIPRVFTPRLAGRRRRADLVFCGRAVSGQTSRTLLKGVGAGPADRRARSVTVEELSPSEDAETFQRAELVGVRRPPSIPPGGVVRSPFVRCAAPPPRPFSCRSLDGRASAPR